MRSEPKGSLALDHCVALLILLLPGAALAQIALVADLAPGSGSAGSDPVPAPLLGDPAPRDDATFYFWATDEAAGRELWRTDGTETGTRRVADLCPGPCDGQPLHGFSAREIHRTRWPGTPLLLMADDGAVGTQLWRVDDTGDSENPRLERLTAICADVDPFSTEECVPDLLFTDFTLDDDRVVFLVRTDRRAFAAWATDGTVAGTGPLWPEGTWADPFRFLTLGEAVYFVAETGAGRELNRTDGVGATPRLAVEACPGPDDGFVGAFERVGDRIVFENGCHGTTGQMWATLGTPATTEPLAPSCFGDCDSLSFRSFRTAVAGSHLYFGYGFDSDLWRTDGTPAGTRRAASLAGLELRSSLYPVGGGVAFLVRDEDQPSIETLVWVDATTGPGQGPRFLAAMDSNSVGATNGDMLLLVSLGGGPNPLLLRTDGTLAGTTAASTDAKSASLPAVAGDRLFFRGDAEAQGAELWTLEAGQSEAVMVADLAGLAAGSRTRNLTPHGDEMLFTAFGGNSPTRQIWSTDRDGVVTTARRVVDELGQPLTTLQDWTFEARDFDGQAVFGATDGLVSGLTAWSWDGETAPRQVQGLGASPTKNFFSRDWIRLSDRILFLGDDGLGQPLWSLDLGSLELDDEAEQIVDLAPDWRNFRSCFECFDMLPVLQSPIYPRGLTVVETGTDTTQGVVQELAVFAARTDAHGAELWRTDGTAEGTVQVVDLVPGPGSSEPTNFRQVGPYVVFLAQGPDRGPLPELLQRSTDLWVTDGTEELTFLLARLPIPWDQVADENPKFLAASTASGLGVALAYSAYGDFVAPETRSLWFVRAGTTTIPLPRAATDLIQVGESVYFVSGDAEEGTELWRSDGTVEGTERIVVRPGPLGSSPRSLVLRDTPSERALYFAAIGDNSDTDDIHRGHELWRLPLGTDDLPAGPPALAADVRPGPASSNPDRLIFDRAGERLFFEADDGVHGRELWVWNVDEDPDRCVADRHTACIGERFRLRVTFRDDPDGPPLQARTAPASSAPDTADTVYFTFFSDDNLELVIKVLDGTSINRHHWLYYGALSDIEYTITAEDLATGTVRVVDNPRGNLCGAGDVFAFPAPKGAALPRAPTEARPDPAHPRTDHPPPGACRGLPGTLCFYDRFEVSATWQTDDDAGTATPIAFTGETGLFWFFGEDNVELAIKVLDGTPINDRYWVYYGALSDVAYAITVYDTWTDRTRVYENEPGNLCGGADVGAF